MLAALHRWDGCVARYCVCCRRTSPPLRKRKRRRSRRNRRRRIHWTSLCWMTSQRACWQVSWGPSCPLTPAIFDVRLVPLAFALQACFWVCVWHAGVCLKFVYLTKGLFMAESRSGSFLSQGSVEGRRYLWLNDVITEIVMQESAAASLSL